MLLPTLAGIVEASDSPEGAAGQGWQGHRDGRDTGMAGGWWLWEELSSFLQCQWAEVLPQGSPLDHHPLASPTAPEVSL